MTEIYNEAAVERYRLENRSLQQRGTGIPGKTPYLHLIERELDNELDVFKASQSRPSVDEYHLWTDFTSWLSNRPIGRVAQIGLDRLISAHGVDRVAALVADVVYIGQIKLRVTSDPDQPSRTVWQVVE